VGCVSPKILRLKDGDINPGSTEIDSAGMILSRSVRHFDRGAGEEDLGQYNEEGMVFGVTGAGAFFRRRCLEDTRLGEQYFDEDFWSYREDADLSWRIQNFGWECIYVPSSVMYHFRSSRPGNRYANSRLVNMHSVKNRYLLMINNLCGRTYLMNLPWIVSRDIVVMLGVLLREPYSIHAYGFLISNCRRLISKRAQLRSRMDCDRSNFWFGHQVVYRASDRIKQGLG
jgi:GT2 family glycosyltransferase